MGNEHHGFARLWALSLLVGHGRVSAGFIDMDTPLEARTTTSLIDGTVYDLVRTGVLHDFPCCELAPSFF
jgi:hypothetical protein